MLFSGKFSMDMLTKLRRVFTVMMMFIIFIIIICINQAARAGSSTTNKQEIITETETATSADLTATSAALTLEYKSPTPTATSYGSKSIVINEVGWMGTYASSQNEWIELYNTGPNQINLAGWKIRFDKTNYELTLSGKIDGYGYFLLGRKDAANSDLTGPFIDITPDLLYDTITTMPDTGDYLILYDPARNQIDSANSATTTWPAGSAAYFCSMERVGINYASTAQWVTNNGSHTNGHDKKNYVICGSPKIANYNVTPTASKTATKTITPIPPYRTPTKTPTPKKSLTPTINPNATPIPFVYLNEFLPQPRFDWNGDGKINEGDSFIEIVNIGSKTVSLTGWSLDDDIGDSTPYKFDALTIEAGAHVTFFASKTGISLSTGGDTVRLIKSNGSIADAFTYPIVKVPNQSWCRIKDGNGSWQFGCMPTINGVNKLAQTTIFGKQDEPIICLKSFMPLILQQAECDVNGQTAWGSILWTPSLLYPKFIDAGIEYYIIE